MIIDIIVLIVVGLGFFNGFKRGLINTVFDTLSLLVAVVATLKLSPLMIGFIQKVISNQSLAFILGFVITFLLVIFIIRFIGDRLTDAVEAIQLDSINKLLGGAVMGLFMAVLLSFMIFFGQKSNLISEKAISESNTYSLLQPLPEASKSLIAKSKPMFTGFWDKMMETFDSIKEKGEELQ